MGPLFQFFNIIHSDNIERDWKRRNSAYQGFSLFTFSLARTPNIQLEFQVQDWLTPRYV